MNESLKNMFSFIHFIKSSDFSEDFIGWSYFSWERNRITQNCHRNVVNRINDSESHKIDKAPIKYKFLDWE